MVGIPESALQIGPFALLFCEKRISGGVPASRQETVQMPELLARKGIRPQVEVFPMADINRAVERVRSGQARYRAVAAA